MPAGKKLGGRVKGTPNKVTSDLRAMILGALDKAGGIKYLLKQAEENPSAFLTLAGKCMPKEISGPNGGDIPTSVVFRFVDV